ncbi:MAG: hypothetical protein PHV30_05610 [Candidatus Margulisbacteria bacterium]|nr:hypothetical protein [Candidatus Margulisiibacteriota bacterium]
MKKVLVLSLIALFAISMAYEPKFAANVIYSISGSSGSSFAAPDSVGLGKSRITITSKVSDMTSLVWITKPFSSQDEDYFFVDTITAIGKLRIGNQRLGIANYGGGVYETNTFLSQVYFKSIGVAYMTNIGDTKLNVLAAGGYNNTTSKLGARAITKMGDMNLAGYALLFLNGSTSATAVGVDADTNIAGFGLAGQAYMELGDSGASLLKSGSTAARTFGAAYVSYILPGMNVKLFGDLVMALSDGAKASWGYKTNIKVGASMPLNTETRIFADLTMTTDKNDATANSGQAGFELFL